MSFQIYKIFSIWNFFVSLDSNGTEKSEKNQRKSNIELWVSPYTFHLSLKKKNLRLFINQFGLIERVERERSNWKKESFTSSEKLIVKKIDYVTWKVLSIISHFSMHYNYYY